MNATPIRPGSPLAEEFWRTGRCVSCPVYDMHGHMGPHPAIYFPAAAPAKMIDAMDAAGVRMLCLSHCFSLASPELGNAPAIEAARAFPGRFGVYLCVNPQYPQHMAAILEGFESASDVAVGFKTHSDQHETPLSDDRYRPMFEFADERELPVLMHTWGGSAFSGAGNVRAVAQRYGRAKLLMGHSLSGRLETACDIANECPNVHLELTSLLGRRGVLELLCERAGSDRMLYGTDLPWFDEYHAIGSVLSADITDDDVHNILHRNAEAILGVAD